MMKKIIMAICIFFALTANAFADLKQDYTKKIVSGEIDPTEISFEQFKEMNKSSGVDLKKEYTNKIVSGEIDPTEISFEQYKQMNTSSGVDLKKEYTNKIVSGEIDPTEISFEQFKATFGENPSVQNSNPSKPKAADESVDNSNQNEISTADDGEDFEGDEIGAWVEKFENDYDVSMGMADNGRTFYSGKATVNVGPLDPAYPKELTIAYEKALLDLQANVIMETYGNMSSDRITDFFEDDSTNAREFPPAKVKEEVKKGKLERVLDKVLDLTEKKLDSALEEEGVNKDEINKMSVTQKKQLFKDNFTKNMTKKAFGNMSGLVPVKTTIVKSKEYNAIQVGVIAVISEKTIQFAKDISKSRPTNIKGTPKRIRDVLPKSPKGYLDEFGLRYIYDKKGRPMLLSYGRWSVVQNSKDPSRAMRKLQSAQNKAKMFAEAAIGEFINSNISVLDKADIDSISEEVATSTTEFQDGKSLGSKESSDSVKESLDVAFKKIQAKSNFKLRGTSGIKKWKVKDENGLTHVGVVVAWTYDKLENADNFAKGVHKKDSKIAAEREKKQAVTKTRESRVVNDINDF